jgi:mannose-6-phosphate isomerase-like protein (cupin superfamily)
MNIAGAFNIAKKTLAAGNFKLINEDMDRPWGGFLVVDESQAVDFIKKFFPAEIIEETALAKKLSPKLLVVGPGKRLSWQYHLRRNEIWQCIYGSVGVIASPNDEETEMVYLKSGDMIRLKQGERHRLVGLDDWCIIAEIWIHTDPDHPSDEEDIIRLQDDYNRLKL